MKPLAIISIVLSIVLSVGGINCPAPDQGPTGGLGSGNIIIIRKAANHQVCTLVRISNVTNNANITNTYLAPLGRSYNKRNWENSAGPYAETLNFDCTLSTSSCRIKLPKLDDPTTEKFVLMTYTREAKREAEASRFLEQATFGPTTQEIIALNASSSLDFGKWIRDQINVKPTLHRSYFRSRANARSNPAEDLNFDDVLQAPLDNPCEVGARWRRFAFDGEQAHTKMKFKVSAPNNSSKWFLVSDAKGNPRTEVNRSLWEKHYNDGDSFSFCEVEEKINGALSFRMPSSSSCVALDGINNTLIEFHETLPRQWFKLPLPSLRLFAEFNYSTNPISILKQKITWSNCSTVQSNADSPLYALSYNSNYWLMHDSRIVLVNNTEINPAAEVVTSCFDVKRDFLNSKGCKMSTQNATCSQYASYKNRPEKTIVCGSPGETKNDPSYGDEFDMVMDDFDKPQSEEHFEAQKYSVWNTIVLYQKDQLRQRMAWALSQIFALEIGVVGRFQETEMYLAYYDIFVRNAFGNYRDILKEIAYNPLMGKMLSYVDNLSVGYNDEINQKPNVFPDENFAREIMQLYSIGLVRLNMNGTTVSLSGGEAEPTYSNMEVMDNARSWTGFIAPKLRGNIEAWISKNGIDPMRIDPSKRDKMPKADIYGGYLGDGFPLCVDLPEKQFLRKGAKYILLGNTYQADLQSVHLDPSESVNHMVLQNTSQLYQALCKPINGTCNFMTEVLLQDSLMCNGTECDIDEPKVVKIEAHDIYYEYVRPSCVQFPFYKDALKVKQRSITGDAMCADPRMPVAMEACGAVSSTVTRAVRKCVFSGERLTYSTAQERCNLLSQQGTKQYTTCSWRFISTLTEECGNKCCAAQTGYHWSSVACTILAKVNPAGLIAIVHNHTDLDLNTNNWRGTIAPSFAPKNVNFFRVRWESDRYPSNEQFTCTEECKVSSTDNSCICPVSVIENVVFDTIPNDKDAIKYLKIGALNPENVDSCKEIVSQASENRVTAWSCTGSDVIDKDTIFKVVRSYRPTAYLKNVISWVHINGGAFKFRNPPHFISHLDSNLRDSQYETDAVLDQFFYHPNTAPFLSLRLIQRFGISNPSPAYIEAVAIAFSEGAFVQNNSTNKFGTGNYGDLEATSAAILLHPEARSVVLDADPTYGSVREPILRVMHLMRSMELKYNEAMYPHVKTIRMAEKIGQMAHSSPSVFSFFSPDYKPPGRINAASLVSPEASMVNTNFIVGYLNGMFSLIKNKLSSCDGGFGPDSVKCGQDIGALTYRATQASDIDTAIADLNLLLTGERLSNSSLAVIKEAAQSETLFERQLQIITQLIISTPEFNTRGLVIHQDMRVESPLPQKPSSDYKAIVFYFMSGGVDSYSLLVPDSEMCNNLYNKYLSIRGPMNMTNAELTSPIYDETQTDCKSFRMHKSASTVAELYTRGDAILLANTGVLLDWPVTLDNWGEKHRATELFAHDRQQREIKKIDPFNEAAGTGVLGRIADSLSTRKYQVGSFAIEAGEEALSGEILVSPTVKNLKAAGPVKFDPNPTNGIVFPAIKKLNNNTSFNSNFFGELWSAGVMNSLSENGWFVDTFNQVKIDKFGGTRRVTTTKLETVAKLIKSRDIRGTDRDFFFVELPAWDVHDDARERTHEKLVEATTALDGFVDEMIKQDRWKDTIVIMLSEFGRSLLPNSSGGCDHGWGGNYWVAGGSIAGGKILGKYPKDFEELNIAHMRMMPTTPIDAVWNGIAEWVGVPEIDMDSVLPNRKKFPDLFKRSDMFKDTITSTS